MALTESDIIKLIEKSRLEVTYKFEAPPICLEIVNEEEYESTIFGTYGNFSTIIAPPKVGKTTLAAIPVASYLTKNGLSGFVSHVTTNKERVLWIDTEQGKNEAINTIKTICRFSGLGYEKQPTNLDYITLRQFGHDVRVQLVDFLIYHSEKIGLVVIDGIRDLINSINDEREATFIVGKLLKWSEEKNIHIIVILHQNKGDGNARGHLGTELMNKAETVVNLSKEMQGNERQTIVEPKYNRHKEFKSFAVVLRNNMPQMISINEYIPEKPKVNQLTNIQKVKLLESIFSDNTFLGYGSLWQSVKKNMKTLFEIEFGDNKCKDLVTLLKNENYLIYDEQTKHYQKNI